MIVVILCFKAADVVVFSEAAKSTIVLSKVAKSLVKSFKSGIMSLLVAKAAKSLVKTSESRIMSMLVAKAKTIQLVGLVSSVAMLSKDFVEVSALRLDGLVI